MKNYPHIEAFLRRTGRSLFLYDLETNGFVSSSHFAVLELAYHSFSLDKASGQVSQKKGAQLFSTSEPLDSRASEITGITASMLKGMPSFEKCFSLLKAVQSRPDVLVSGYNVKSFDNNALMKECASFGWVFEGFDAQTWDVRSLYCKLHSTRKGSLSQAAANYGVPIPDGLHRAAADVALTVDLLEAILSDEGVDRVLGALALPRLISPGKSTPVAKVAVPLSDSALDERILRFIPTAKDLEDLFVLCQAPMVDVQKRLGILFDNRKISSLDNFVDLSQSAALAEILQNEDPAFHSGYLKPYMEVCASKGLSTDYLTLRHALFNLGYPWTTLKSLS